MPKLYLPYRWILYSLVLLCLYAGQSFCRADILVHSGQKVAFMGDSITANGWSQPGGYVKLIVDALAKEGVEVTPIPAGVSGNTSKDMLARLNRDVLAKKTDWMTLSCGVNDVWHGANGVDLNSYKKNITEIVDKATSAGIKVVLLTSTPIGEDDNGNNRKLAAYNDFLRDLAARDHLPVADLNADFGRRLKNEKTTAASRFLTVDGVHMNAGGNVLMAQGCLRAFGVPDADLNKIEQEWLAQSNTAMFTVSADPRPLFGLNLAQYRLLEKAAKDRGTDVMQISNTLWLQALGKVMQAHQSDLVIDQDQVKNEANAALVDRINQLAAK